MKKVILISATLYIILFIYMVWANALRERVNHHLNEGWSLEAATHISKVDLYLAFPDEEYQAYMED